MRLYQVAFQTRRTATPDRPWTPRRSPGWRLRPADLALLGARVASGLSRRRLFNLVITTSRVRSSRFVPGLPRGCLPTR